MADSSIEWTDSTWNPVAGCTVITAGCTNCYAMRMAARLAAMGQPKYNGLTRKSGRRHVWTGAIRCDGRRNSRSNSLSVKTSLVQSDLPARPGGSPGRSASATRVG
jgi:protein gp37